MDGKIVNKWYGYIAIASVFILTLARTGFLRRYAPAEGVGTSTAHLAVSLLVQLELCGKRACRLALDEKLR